MTSWSRFVSDIAFSFNLSDLKETIRSANAALNAWPFAKSARSVTIGARPATLMWVAVGRCDPHTLARVVSGALQLRL